MGIENHKKKEGSHFMSKKSVFLKMAWLTLALMLSFLYSKQSGSEDIGLITGLRASVSAGDNKEDFTRYEWFADYDPAWEWRFSSTWNLGLIFNAAAGVLHGGGDTGFLASLGPGVVIYKPQGIIRLTAGVSPSILSRENYGDEDLGSAFQLISYIGVNFQLTRNLTAGYRFQHMSNAGTGDKNPGVNFHTVELGYVF
jgi:lipid A 3-O-deacylase